MHPLNRHARFVTLLISVVACDGQRSPPRGAPSNATSARDDAEVTADVEHQSSTPSVGIANPASSNCVEKGGTLQVASAPNGQLGVCTFSDGTRCEEWRLLRGQCIPGSCRVASGICE